MAAASVQGEGKQSRAASREGHASSSSSSSSSSPESSLSWCLAHLFKPRTGADHPGSGKTDSGGGRETDKRSRTSQWRALVAIRMQHIKGDAGISRFRTQGGLPPLLNLLKEPECSRKTLDLALSILANCCTDLKTRIEVRKLDGINIVVGILKRNVAQETIQNRAARSLGNLAMDPQSCSLIHSSGGIPLLLLCVSLSSAPSSPTAAPPKDPCPKLECAQSAARALGYLSDSPSNRLSLLTQGTLSALAPLLAPEYPQGLRRVALKTLHELTRGCGIECAREVSRSGVIAQLGVMALGEDVKPFEELALKTLANMCSQGCLRPLVGSLGVIQKFTEEVKKDPLKSGVFLKALCLCCKEAVNRAKVKESGGLEVLTSFLSAHQNHHLSWLIILACVDFVFDESAMEQLQELGLVPLLIARLVQITRGEKQCVEKMDVSPTSNMSPTELLPTAGFDSFDFPAPESCKKEEAGSSSFQSLTSWLVSEGLISSEGDLLDSSGVDGEWGNVQIPPSSSPQTSAPSKFSSPHRRRQRAPSSASATKVTSDTPPSAPRPMAYHHPYHPEPWTTESPILLLLSCFSHATDPSLALVSSGIMSGLLYYLTQHRDPSSRCFRMLCRLSCNPNCLQALVRTGSVGLIYHHLCQREGGLEGEVRQTSRVKNKVKQLGVALLTNLRVQCESGFGSGVLAHVMMSGSDSDKMNCALSLPFISSNKSLLRKLLLDSGGLLLALQPLGCDDEDDLDEGNPAEFGKLLSDLFNSPHAGQTSQVHSLYFSLLSECLSALTSNMKTETDKKHLNLAATHSVSKMGRVLPPPSKKPRLTDKCSYSLSNFDLLLLLDDGTQVPANREAVAGVEGTDRVGSEYFRALLRGGFGEAQGNAGEPIRIKDVSTGMLLPVLHYLHGCRLTKDRESPREGDEGESGRQCQIFDSLVLEGLRSRSQSAEDFQKTPLGEMMIGACRFLVTELQRELEDLCESCLLSCSTKAAATRADPAPPTGDNPERAAVKMDQEYHESAEEKLAHQTSELELSGLEMQTEDLPGQAKKANSSPQQTHNQKASFVGAVKRGHGSSSKTVKSVSSGSKSSCGTIMVKSFKSEESRLKPKNLNESSARLLKSAAQESDADSGAGALASLLLQVYWFSQCYSYPALGRACLSLLLGCQDCPRPFSSSSFAADCLRRLAREAGCAETLKQDLLSLATAALS